MLGKFALKLVGGCLVTWLVMAGAVHEVRVHYHGLLGLPTTSTALSDAVTRGTWAPVRAGKTLPIDAIRFGGGQVTTVRCPAVLGSYTVSSDGSFTFQAGTAAIARGCPGIVVRRALARASHVHLSTRGQSDTLVVSAHGHRLLRLQQTTH